jgi:hypothetical protein
MRKMNPEEKGSFTKNGHSFFFTSVFLDSLLPILAYDLPLALMHKKFLSQCAQ